MLNAPAVAPIAPPARVPAPGATLPAAAPVNAIVPAFNRLLVITLFNAVVAYGAICHIQAEEEEPTADGTEYIHLLGSVHLNSLFSSIPLWKRSSTLYLAISASSVAISSYNS